MEREIITYRDWELEVDRELTEQTYQRVLVSGATSCPCSDCKNYVAYRDRAFPEEIIILFSRLGIDPRKEVEIMAYEVLSTGFHHIGGWFHFAGRLLSGPSCRVPFLQGGDEYNLQLTDITGDFSIGFAKGNDLAFFDDKTELVQVEFTTSIPWVIDKSLEIVQSPSSA